MLPVCDKKILKIGGMIIIIVCRTSVLKSFRRSEV